MNPAQARVLSELLNHVSVAALGTVDAGVPFVSMAPFAIAFDGRALLLHVSGLAAHTRNMTANPAVSLLVMEPEAPGRSPLALARVTIQGRARPVSETASDYPAARDAYLRRFPQSAELFQLGDFQMFAIEVVSARLVAGFAQASSLTAEAFAAAAAGAV